MIMILSYTKKKTTALYREFFNDSNFKASLLWGANDYRVNKVNVMSYITHGYSN